MPATVRVCAEYGVLVGVPILVIVAVLHAGAAVSAPPDVAGTWELTAVPPAPLAAECRVGSSSEISIVVRVSQSGRYLSAGLRGWPVDATGTIAGRRVGLEWPAGEGRSRVRLDAEVVEQGGTRALAGRIAGACGDRKVSGTRTTPVRTSAR